MIIPLTPRKKIVCLYSGGLDSLIMYRLAQVKYPDAEIKCIYYMHGAESEAGEVYRLPDYVEVRQVDWLNESCRPIPKASDPFAGAIYIPGRNLVFATLAACQELPDQIWMGTLVDENNEQATDKNDIFLEKANDALNYVLSPFRHRHIHIKFPFVEHKWTKMGCIMWALENGLTKEDIQATISCWHYDKHDMPCGECKACYKRALVFGCLDIEEKCHTDPLICDHGKKLTDKFMETLDQRDFYPFNEDEENVRYMIKMMRAIGKLL